jgi:hypothetical protein
MTDEECIQSYVLHLRALMGLGIANRGRRPVEEAQTELPGSEEAPALFLTGPAER